MKKLFRKLFANNILLFHERTNRFLVTLMNIPGLGRIVSPDIFDEKHHGIRKIVGIIAQLFAFVGEFLQRLIYVLMLIYVPYRLIAHFRPLIYVTPEISIMFMFVMLSVVCGSLANNTVLAVDDRDYMMIRIMQISPYMNFLGRILYKIATEFVYYSLVLMIFGVSPINSILLSLVNACAKPIGEMAVILVYEYTSRLYAMRNIYNGVIMAVCVLLAYGYPIVARSISANWYVVVNPVFVAFMLVAGGLAMYYLWWYKHYRNLVREALFIKHE